ncbi:MAG: hypothetical protein RR356_04450 [Bacteroidales bacterium]
MEIEEELNKFIKGKTKEIEMYNNSAEKIIYDPEKRVEICIAKLETSLAISIGAYVYALSQIDNVE